MQHTIKWWTAAGEKAVGIEYRSFSPLEIEPFIRELLDSVSVSLIEIRDASGALVAHYPDSNTYRARGRSTFRATL